jgi:hypothetical protein
LKQSQKLDSFYGPESTGRMIKKPIQGEEEIEIISVDYSVVALAE